MSAFAYLSRKAYCYLPQWGPDTLKELRISLQAVGAKANVHNFVDMHDIGDKLFRDSVCRSSDGYGAINNAFWLGE